MINEEEVTERVADYLREWFPEQSVNTGEIECTGESTGTKNWRADIVVGESFPYLLCVECKGGAEYRKGIGQAIGFAAENRMGGFACNDPPETVRKMMDMAPIHGFAVMEDEVDHFSTNAMGSNTIAAYFRCDYGFAGGCVLLPRAFEYPDHNVPQPGSRHHVVYSPHG